MRILHHECFKLFHASGRKIDISLTNVYEIGIIVIRPCNITIICDITIILERKNTLMYKPSVCIQLRIIGRG